MSEDHDWVRRLLAEEGQSPEPMPPEVAARLDGVLEEQAASRDTAEQGSESAPATDDPGDQRVVPMTGRRQRRWAGALLAAAALTVGGYSLTATGLLDGFSGAGSESTSAESAEAGGASAGGATDDRQESEVAPDSGAGAADGDVGVERELLATSEAELSSETLRRDASRLVSADGRGTLDTRTDRPPERNSSSATSSAQESADCVPPPVGLPGTRLAVSLDGRPATALLRRTGEDRTVVTVWDCASPSRLAHVVVPR